MTEPFEIDPYPGKPRILFIGLGASTHTLAWIDLLCESELNVRLFALPNGGPPPEDWNVRTYLPQITQNLPEDLNLSIRKTLYPTPEEIKTQESNTQAKITKIKRNPIFRLLFLMKRILNQLGSPLGLPPLNYEFSKIMYSPKLEGMSAEAWLSAIIQGWQPQIIQTLGLFDGQGGLFYNDSRKAFRLEKIGKWVLQLRGGSDIAIRRHNPEAAQKILEILSECDEIVTDNYVNIKYIQELGLGGKIAPIAPVPGTGGVDTDFEIEDIILPSYKERLILWPKAYESSWSKALPVLEALKLAWDEIKPCKVYMTWSIPEVETWFWTLPEEIRDNCVITQRIPRNELLDLMRRARVLLAPSLVDGVPNSLYEAMVNATFPIVSPLDTIQPVVKNEMNVLFARNLYPDEISRALVRAMNDDELVDNAAKNNLELVKKIASRQTISRKVIEYYENITGRYPKEYLIKNKNHPLVTIITPAYNRAKYLPETIESVLSQDYPNIEYIVLDDGSKDNTLDTLKKYGDKIIVESHENIGETKTVNKGFEMAKGEFICVVNSDDPLLPCAITKIVTALMAEPEAMAAYPDWLEVDPQSKPIKEMRLPEYDINNMLTDFNVAMGPGNIFRRSALEKVGFRETTRKYTGDLEFWFRLASHGKLKHVPEILATHRTHPQSASVSDKSSKMAEELLSIVTSLFASGGLPEEINGKRDQILSRAYHESVFYCLNEPARMLKYSMLSLLYDPKEVIKNEVILELDELFSLLKNIFGLVIFGVAIILHISLSEKAYNALLVWWRSLRKSNPEAATKIAFVSHVLPPSWSGQSVMIGRILKNISPTKYCLISTENYQNEQEGNTGFLPGKYYVLPKDPGLLKLGAKYWIMNWLRAFYRGLRIARIIGKEKCNIIAAASGNLIDIPAGWWASVFTGARFVPYLFDDYLYQWADEQTRFITRNMEKRIFSRVKTVIVPNEFMRDEIQMRQNVKAAIVRNPCASISENESLPIMTEYNPRVEIRIVYTGAIYHVNFDAFKNLIEATRQIEANIKIHIYTAQPSGWLEQNGVKGSQIVHHPHSVYAEALEAQNHAHILFLPFSFHSPIPEIIKTSAPGKTGEYLNSGVPILAHVPPDTFINWYFRKYDCGYIVDTEEIVTLKYGIENLISDSTLRKRLVTNAKARARVDYDPIVSSKAFMQAMVGAI